jgi:hypothetical protein
MPRLANQILTNQPSWAQGRENAMVDLTLGGQMGYAPDLTQYLGNQSYIRKNLICLLLEAPTGFALMPDAQQWVSTLRALVELHPLSIEGLTATLDVEVQETAPVGGGGEQHQDFVNVTRARSEPTFRWTEKYGRPIEQFLRQWIELFIMDPDTKIANIATLTGIATPTDMLADRYSMTCAFIEPDPTHTKVVKSWIVTNMFPHSSGEVVGRRELTAPGEATTYDIKFSGLSQYGLGVDQFCQGLLDSISIKNANPYQRKSFIDTISADVAATTASYANGATNVANAQVAV